MAITFLPESDNSDTSKTAKAKIMVKYPNDTKSYNYTSSEVVAYNGSRLGDISQIQEPLFHRQSGSNAFILKNMAGVVLLTSIMISL